MVKTESEAKKPGSAWGTGRPSTGRNITITVRISEQSAEILKDEHNKSELIDKLIKYYAEHLKM